MGGCSSSQASSSPSSLGPRNGRPPSKRKKPKGEANTPTNAQRPLDSPMTAQEPNTDIRSYNERRNDEEDKKRHQQAPRIDEKMCADDFTFLTVIGKGSFGKVMQVRHKPTGSIYAMKILKKNQLIRRKQVVHTKTERSILVNMRHPFIVSLRFAFQTPQKLYMVLDFFNGGELFFHLRRARRFELSRSQFYAAEIASALGCLHKNGIIYRDLKPENILLGNDGHIRVTDFGLSKDAVENGQLTHTFCGTPEYLAPEIIQQKGHSYAVDWWSFGVLIYEMLLGVPPFYAENVNKMYQKILKGPLKFYRSMNLDTRDLLKGLLNRNPAKRLGSTNDIKEIQEHAWFKHIDFVKLECLQISPPMVPNLSDNEDTSLFDQEFTDLPAKDTPLQVTNSVIAAEGAFPGFTYKPKNDLCDSENDICDEPIGTADDDEMLAQAMMSYKLVDLPKDKPDMQRGLSMMSTT